MEKKTLSDLLYLYQQGITSPYQLEFLCYDTILYVNDASKRVHLFQTHALNSTNLQHPFLQGTRTLLSVMGVSDTKMKSFDFAHYLDCLLHIPLGLALVASLHLDRLRRNALAEMVFTGYLRDGKMATKVSVTDLTLALKFETEEQCISFVTYFGVPLLEDEQVFGLGDKQLWNRCIVDLKKPEATKFHPHFLDAQFNESSFSLVDFILGLVFTPSMSSDPKPISNVGTTPSSSSLVKGNPVHPPSSLHSTLSSSVPLSPRGSVSPPKSFTSLPPPPSSSFSHPLPLRPSPSSSFQFPSHTISPSHLTAAKVPPPTPPSTLPLSPSASPTLQSKKRARSPLPPPPPPTQVQDTPSTLSGFSLNSIECSSFNFTPPNNEVRYDKRPRQEEPLPSFSNRPFSASPSFTTSLPPGSLLFNQVSSNSFPSSSPVPSSSSSSCSSNEKNLTNPPLPFSSFTSSNPLIQSSSVLSASSHSASQKATQPSLITKASAIITNKSIPTLNLLNSHAAGSSVPESTSTSVLETHLLKVTNPTKVTIAKPAPSFVSKPSSLSRSCTPPPPILKTKPSTSELFELKNKANHFRSHILTRHAFHFWRQRALHQFISSSHTVSLSSFHLSLNSLSSSSSLSSSATSSKSNLHSLISLEELFQCCFDLVWPSLSKSIYSLQHVQRRHYVPWNVLAAMNHIFSLVKQWIYLFLLSVPLKRIEFKLPFVQVDHASVSITLCSRKECIDLLFNALTHSFPSSFPSFFAKTFSTSSTASSSSSSITPPLTWLSIPFGDVLVPFLHTFITQFRDDHFQHHCVGIRGCPETWLRHWYRDLQLKLTHWLGDLFVSMDLVCQELKRDKCHFQSSINSSITKVEEKREKSNEQTNR